MLFLSLNHPGFVSYMKRIVEFRNLISNKTFSKKENEKVAKTTARWWWRTKENNKYFERDNHVLFTCKCFTFFTFESL
jgi:hypothetical protein